ncbi:MAG TPA: L,D-transpeptidase family protein [Ilumatobacteraceae bacterium]|nr:L,D-transpeptidase family protein [Ilumatobacteraceae bacterium]
MVVEQRRRALIGTLVVLGSVALVGCSTAVTSGSVGDGASAALASTTSSPTTTPTTATTLAPATTLVPVTTEATLAPETTEATTTLAPPTTLPANVVAPLVEPLRAVGGGGGADTARVQMRLLELGFWLSGADGGYGLTTKQAVMAFQKYMSLNASGRVDQATADALSAMTQRPAARANSGTLIEVDKSKQLLFFVIDNTTAWILNTSTGNGEEYTEEDKNTPGEVITGVSLTPDGLHRVTRERPEGWWEGDLGEIYRPKYFVGGVAVHGSNSIPNYPASHGCVRVSVPAMDWIWDSGIMPLRTPVWVHGG